MRLSGPVRALRAGPGSLWAERSSGRCGRLLTGLGALLATLFLAAGAHGSPLAGAVADLRATGVHVSPRALGEAAPAAAVQLREIRARLAKERRTVLLVIAPGPVASPGMTAYARRLSRESDLPGAVVVTAPGHPVAIWGPEPRPPVLAAIAASGANDLPNPVERVATAATIAVPPDPEPDGVRTVVILMLLALLGGAWAAAWGAHRTDRSRGRSLSEARAQLRLWLDALRMQARRADISHLPPSERQRVDQVMALCTDTLNGLHGARTVADVTTLAPRVRAGFAELTAATGGATPPLTDAFAGLCANDPVHGAALTTAVVGDRGTLPVCRDCRDDLADGRIPPLRMVPIATGALPYTALSADDPDAIIATD